MSYSMATVGFRLWLFSLRFLSEKFSSYIFFRKGIDRITECARVYKHELSFKKVVLATASDTLNDRWLKNNRGEPDAKINPQDSGEQSEKEKYKSNLPLVTPFLSATKVIFLKQKLSLRPMRQALSNNSFAMTFQFSLLPFDAKQGKQYLSVMQKFYREGGIVGTVVDVRIIAKYAVDSLCCSLIIAHNHPSGNTQPSQADRNITDKIKNALALF